MKKRQKQKGQTKNAKKDSMKQEQIKMIKKNIIADWQSKP